MENKNLEELTKKIDFILNILDKNGFPYVGEISEDWFMTHDEKKFISSDGIIAIRSNWNTWEESYRTYKLEESSEVFYIRAEDNTKKNNVYLGLSLEKAIGIHKYLGEKIDYLLNDNK